jgi:uncharacterized membrane protein YhaH (DUF805 family)
MKPKTLTTLYWVFTLLFALLMLLSAVGGLQPSAGSIKIMHDGMGYPVYFIRFISVAKLLGAIAICVPQFNRIKEWAYAGLFFDLAGALYSGIASAGKFDPLMLTMLIWIVPGILSYVYWQRRVSAGVAFATSGASGVFVKA